MYSTVLYLTVIVKHNHYYFKAKLIRICMYYDYHILKTVLEFQDSAVLTGVSHAYSQGQTLLTVCGVCFGTGALFIEGTLW